MKTKTRKKQQAKPIFFNPVCETINESAKPRRSISLEEHSRILEEAVTSTRTHWNDRIDLINVIEETKASIKYIERELLNQKVVLKAQQEELDRVNKRLQEELQLSC